MQPPPRKVKTTVALKTIHHEQLTKLQQKHQHDVDLLEDIRNFAKQRSQIEKDYAQALLKLANSYLSKKDFYMLPDIPSEDGRDHKTATSVWRTVLEVTECIARERLVAAETYMQQVSEPIKNLKTQKQQNAKKTLEQFATIQGEVAHTVREMTKLQKIYNDEEKLAHDARKKSDDAEEKVKRRSTGLFSSLASLQKNSAKLQVRKDQLESKSSISRNEYLLAMAACNAHLMRFYQTDMPGLMKSIDGEMFEKIQMSFTELSKTELQCCGLTQECFSKALCDSTLISRQYNQQCFLSHNPAFTELMQYQFEPCENDAIHKLSYEAKGENSLDSEAKKWATKIAKENKAMREYSKTLKALLTDGDKRSASDSSSPDAESKDLKEKPVDPEVRIEECQENIRKAETAKLKAEARLELLREVGIDVDDWLNKVNMDTLSPNEDTDEVSRTSDQISVRTSSSGGHSEDTSYHNGPSSHADYNGEEYDMNDETFERSNASFSSGALPSPKKFPVQAIALYDFQAGSTDEMSIAANEEVTVVAMGDGEGWVKARNSRGQEGYIPENYIQYQEEQSSYSSAQDYSRQTSWPSESGQTSLGTDRDYSRQTSWPSESGQTSFGTDGTSYTSEQSGFSSSMEQPAASSQPSNALQSEAVSSYSSTDYEVQQTMTTKEISLPTDCFYAKALYDYDANIGEELSFQEGQVIKVTQKEPHGVDDGWWGGELGGRTGVFPSMVVMEMVAEDLVHDMLSPVRPGPPSFAPPGIVSSEAPGGPPGAPQAATSPPPVTVTLPTPPSTDTSGTLIDLNPVGGPPTDSGGDATDGATNEPAGGSCLDELLMDSADDTAVMNPAALPPAVSDMMASADIAPGSPMPDRNKEAPAPKEDEAEVPSEPAGRTVDEVGEGVLLDGAPADEEDNESAA